MTSFCAEKNKIMRLSTSLVSPGMFEMEIFMACCYKEVMKYIVFRGKMYVGLWKGRFQPIRMKSV